MDRAKSLIVALVRFYGVLFLFYALFIATYLGPIYRHYQAVFANPAAHSAAAMAFYVEICHFALRLGVGLALISEAESIIDSLRPAGAEPGLKSLIVAVVKLSGFLLLFYGAISAIDLAPFIGNIPRFGLAAMRNSAPYVLRFGLNMLAGFLVITSADKILDRLEPRVAGA